MSQSDKLQCISLKQPRFDGICLPYILYTPLTQSVRPPRYCLSIFQSIKLILLPNYFVLATVMEELCGQEAATQNETARMRNRFQTCFKPANYFNQAAWRLFKASHTSIRFCLEHIGRLRRCFSTDSSDETHLNLPSLRHFNAIKSFKSIKTDFFFSAKFFLHNHRFHRLCTFTFDAYNQNANTGKWVPVTVSLLRRWDG